MRTTREEPKVRRARTAAPTVKCAHCGAQLEERVPPCGDCLFVYCREHDGAEFHLCAEICLECAEPEEPRH